MLRETMPGWTGAAIAEAIEKHTGLTVSVENDANATAIAEKEFGIASTARDFVCLTLGTGVGGGCFTRNELNRGAHYFGNALGHIMVEPDGLPCTCGQRGCLEMYANAAALVRYAGDRFPSAADVIWAANEGDPGAENAVNELARYLARGSAILVQVLDPELVIFSGGLTQNNPRLAPCSKANYRVWFRNGSTAGFALLFRSLVITWACSARLHWQKDALCGDLLGNSDEIGQLTALLPIYRCTR